GDHGLVVPAPRRGSQAGRQGGRLLVGASEHDLSPRERVVLHGDDDFARPHGACRGDGEFHLVVAKANGGVLGAQADATAGSDHQRGQSDEREPLQAPHDPTPFRHNRQADSPRPRASARGSSSTPSRPATSRQSGWWHELALATTRSGTAARAAPAPLAAAARVCKPARNERRACSSPSAANQARSTSTITTPSTTSPTPMVPPLMAKSMRRRMFLARRNCSSAEVMTMYPAARTSRPMRPP